MKDVNAMTLKEFREMCIVKDTKIEGGLTKGDTLKDDLGGLTNHGITQAKAKQYSKQLIGKFDWDKTMENLSKEMAFYVYEQDFWHGMQLDRVADKYSRRLANVMFRWGLKSGQGRPVSHIQTLLNTLNNKEKYWDDLVVDGHIGNKTFAAMDALVKKRGTKAAKVIVYCSLQSAMETWMVTISAARENNETFTWGWLTRCTNERSQYIEEYGVPKL